MTGEGNTTWLIPGHVPTLIDAGTGEIAVVAPFRYSVMAWAIASGFIVWGEVPDLMSWIGIAIVSLAGLYTFLREQHLARLAKARGEFGSRPMAPAGPPA